MADEPKVAPEDQDTPDDAVVEETPAAVPAGTDNFEQRYNDLRPEFDRRNALLTAAEGQQGPEAQAQALRQLGVDVELEQEQEVEDEGWVDPDERIDRLEAQIAQSEESAEESKWEQREESFLDTTLTQLENQDGVKLTGPEVQFVVTNALSDRDAQSGEPNVKAAFEAIQQIRKDAASQYMASKKAPAAPVGSQGETKIDFRDGDARRKFMAEDMASRMGES